MLITFIYTLLHTILFHSPLISWHLWIGGWWGIKFRTVGFDLKITVIVVSIASLTNSQFILRLGTKLTVAIKVSGKIGLDKAINGVGGRVALSSLWLGLWDQDFESNVHYIYIVLKFKNRVARYTRKLQLNSLNLDGPN